jgi:hypothetical protein
MNLLCEMRAEGAVATLPPTLTTTRKDRAMANHSITHGMSASKEFGVWWAMRQRCENPRNKHFYNYGARGIIVCKRWMKFANFISDMGSRPFAGATIERKDNDGPYSPENCRWATRAEQQRNRRNNVKLTINGETAVLKDWAARHGISPVTVAARLRRGMDPLQALTAAPGSVGWAASGAKGVYHHSGRTRPWQARIHIGGNRYKSLGYFSTREDAAEAYRLAAEKMHACAG